MKNFFKSKGFIVTSLAVLCITILGVCWYAGQDKSDPPMHRMTIPIISGGNSDLILL